MKVEPSPWRVLDGVVQKNGGRLEDAVLIKGGLDTVRRADVLDGHPTVGCGLGRLRCLSGDGGEVTASDLGSRLTNAHALRAGAHKKSEKGQNQSPGPSTSYNGAESLRDQPPPSLAASWPSWPSWPSWSARALMMLKFLSRLTSTWVPSSLATSIW